MSPGAAEGLVKIAKEASFQVLRDEAKKVAAEASKGAELGRRQKEARLARHYSDELGMVNVHLRFEPQVGAPIVSRAETEAHRLCQAARASGSYEPYERYLADAYARLLSGGGKPHSSRPELIVVVDHALAARGWKDVRKGERCKIPGVGPIDPKVVRELAEQAVLSIVVEQGKDLRHFKRFARSRPKELDLALRLGEPPGFDGPACFDCGKRLGLELDHAVPVSAGGETSYANSAWRCPTCHDQKTRRERAEGLYNKGGRAKAVPGGGGRRAGKAGKARPRAPAPG